jgi:hypothetical protein
VPPWLVRAMGGSALVYMYCYPMKTSISSPAFGPGFKTKLMSMSQGGRPVGQLGYGPFTIGGTKQQSHNPRAAPGEASSVWS